MAEFGVRKLLAELGSELEVVTQRQAGSLNGLRRERAHTGATAKIG